MNEKWREVYTEEQIKKIQQIEKEHLDRLRAKAKTGQLMLDE